MRYRHILSNTKNNNEMIKSSPKVYLVGYWAKYGVMELPYAGKMVEDDTFGLVPLVYDFNDFNGEREVWFIRKITEATSGGKVIYTFNKDIAEMLADKLNMLEELTKE